MKFRGKELFNTAKPQAQNLPPTPKPKQSEEETAAWAMCAAIASGMQGNQFAKIMNTMQGEAVKMAAGLTCDELIEWFKRDPKARAIIEKNAHKFPEFCKSFHDEARRQHPNAPRPEGF